MEAHSGHVFNTAGSCRKGFWNDCQAEKQLPEHPIKMEE